MLVLGETRPLLVGAGLLALLPGCGLDSEASLSIGSAQPLAEDAFYPLSIGDACAGDPKLPICSTEQVISIDRFDIQDPGVARVLRMSELPADFRISSPEHALLGAGQGNTRVSMEAHFDDGTVRSADTELRVLRPNHVEATYHCSASETTLTDLVAQGSSLSLSVALSHDETTLLGEHIGSLTGEGLTRASGGLRENLYNWTIPGSGAVARVTSYLDEDFELEVRLYGPRDVTLGKPEIERTVALADGSGVAVNVTLSYLVDGQRPCTAFPLTVTILSPDICLGPDDAEQFTVDPTDGFWLSGWASGRCAFELQLADEKAREQSVLVKVPDDIGADDPCALVECEAPDECDEGYELASTADGCCTECQAVQNATLCAAERSEWDSQYQKELETAQDCVFDEDCTITVFAGGCGRHCAIPVSTTAIADFMNALAESHAIDCPHCQIDNPAACNVTARPYCGDAGRCVLYEAETD